MALLATINNEQYRVPLSVADITLSTHLAIVNVEKNIPDELADILKEEDESKRKEMAGAIEKMVYIKKIIPYFARVISAATGIPANVLLGDKQHEGAPVNMIEKWYWAIMAAYGRVSYKEGKRQFLLRGEVWEIPDNLMQKSTFGEFAEAAQYEMYTSETEQGMWDRMPYVLAVLLRPEGEKFDPYTFDEIVEERAEMMRSITMDVVYQVAFFLLGQNAKSGQDIQISMLARLLARQKRAQST